MKTMSMYTFIIMGLLLVFSCNDDSMVTEPEQVYQSEGNIWLPTTMWPDTGNAIHYVSLQDISVNSSNEIFVATDFAGVFKTEDEGTNWTIVNDGFIKFDTDTTYFVSALTSMSNSIYSGNTDLSTIGGIFSLESSAEKWNPRVIWEEYSYVATLETNSKGEIFAGCKSGLYYSQDAGKNWIDVGQDLNWASLAYAYTVAFDSNDKVYIGTRDGMYMSENRGDSWAQLGLASEAVLSIAINSKDEIFASLENEEIMRSTDGGMTWEEVLKLDGNNIRHLFINLNDIIFVSTWKGIYRSNDNGANFEHIGLENTSIEKIVINSEGHMIAGSYRDGIFISKE